MRYGNYVNRCASVGGEFKIIGRTVLGKPIPLIRKGHGKPKTLVVGAVHAREYVTGYLLLDLIAEYRGNDCVDVVPILNIDGASLAEDGLEGLGASKELVAELTKINGGSRDFRLWKANAGGVDLNLNFDADWGKGRGNIFYPAPSGYVGKRPLSEPETQAVARQMRCEDYALVVAYHSKGEEVYWGYGGNLNYRKEAGEIADKLCYKLKTTPYSTGGLKDMFVKESGRLGVTIEVGSDAYPHPYPMEKYGELLNKHRGMVAFYARLARELWTKYTL